MLRMVCDLIYQSISEGGQEHFVTTFNASVLPNLPSAYNLTAPVQSLIYIRMVAMQDQLLKNLIFTQADETAQLAINNLDGFL